MAWSILPRLESLVPLPVPPFAFLPGAGKCATAFRHLPSSLQPLWVELPNHRSWHDVLRWWLHVSGLWSKHRGEWSKGEPIMFFHGEVDWGKATGYCSTEIQRDSVHPGYPPVLTSLNRTPKILGVTLDTHFTFGLHARDCVKRDSRVLNVMKALPGSSWDFTTENLVATYKAIYIVRAILNYGAPSG